MICTHSTTRTIRTTCFFGPVNTDENPAAHGGLTDTDECVACGSRRAANRNGWRVELGPWGPSRAARVQAAQAAEVIATAAVRAVLPVSLSRGPDKAAIRLDAEGFIVIWSSVLADHDAILGAAPDAWLEAAKAARALVVRAQELRAAAR